MSPLKTLMIAFAVSTAGIISTSVAAPVAVAQGTKIIVVDQNKVLEDSMGRADILTKIENIGAQINRELEPESNALDTEGQSLEARVGNRTQEQLQQDTAFTSARTAFLRKRSAFQQKALIRQAELEATQQAAQQELLIAFKDALVQTRIEKGAELVMDATAVADHAQSIDATADVLAKLNASMPTITVTRKTFTEEERQQVLAAVAQQQAQQTQRLAMQGLQQQQAFNRVARANQAAQAAQQQGQ